jgi:hypothetical protein
MAGANTFSKAKPVTFLIPLDTAVTAGLTASLDKIYETGCAIVLSIAFAPSFAVVLTKGPNEYL